MTVYTNGTYLKPLNDIDRTNVNIRIGVLGYDIGDKQLVEIKPPSFKVGIVYMLNRANLHPTGYGG